MLIQQNIPRLATNYYLYILTRLKVISFPSTFLTSKYVIMVLSKTEEKGNLTETYRVNLVS